MNGPARHRWLFRVMALVAAACLFCLLGSSGRLRGASGDLLATPSGGVAFAAGTGSGARRTVQSTFQSECASCHGASGKGGGWTAWLLGLKGRDLTDPSYMGTLKDEYLFQIIKRGGAIFGKPGMPSWGQKLTDPEIRELVTYVRSLSSSRPHMQQTGRPR